MKRSGRSLNLPVKCEARRFAGGISVITLLALVFGCMEPCAGRLGGVIVEAQESQAKAPKRSDEAILISAESNEIVTGKPFHLQVTITNRSERPLLLKYLPQLQLMKGDRDPRTDESGRDSFSGAVYFKPDAYYRLKKSLIPGESISFDVDLTTLKWGRSNSSYMADSTIFEVAPNGNYTLFVSLNNGETEKEKRAYIYSNGLKVTIPSQQP